MKISFTQDGWEDYTSWTNERTTLKRINRMIEEAARAPHGLALERSAGLSYGTSSQVEAV